MSEQIAKKTNLFLVGQPKSGTTALYFFLREHPDIYTPGFKEIHFFCKDFHTECDRQKIFNIFFSWRNLDSYEKLYQRAKEKYLGDFSTNYLYSKVAAKEIFAYNPEAKIIILLRNPVDFLYSWYNHAKIFEDEYAETFAQALELEEKRRAGEMTPANVKVPSFLFYSERIKYAEQVKRFFDLFGKENVKIIIYEKFLKDNFKCYKDILDFLDLSFLAAPEFNKIHESRIAKHPRIYKMFASPRLFKFLSYFLPPRLLFKYNRKKDKYLLAKMKKEELDESLRKKLMRGYKDEVVKISELLDEDLVGFWGYDKID